MAADAVNSAVATAAERGTAVEEYIMHHVMDSHHWALPFLSVDLPSFLSLHGLMVILCAVFLVLLFGVGYRKDGGAPRGLTNFLEVFVLFIRDNIAVPSLGHEDGPKMTPLFCSFFFFVLGLNLMGLVPAFATATSNVSVTAALALITLAFMIFGSIYKNGVGGFFKSFIPHGVPLPILVLLVPIEFVGMFIKAFALTIRLFANMLAGHIVIFSLLGLVYIFGALAAPAIALALGIYFLELFVCFLQAYIFTLLSAMFIGQMYHPAH
jgi:F-type H+-transporting ATPase subunit a